MEEAQFALLRGNESAYRGNLDQVKTWVLTYYQLDQNSTRKLLGRLEALRNMNIKTILPDISNSLRVLKKYRLKRQELDGFNEQKQPKESN